MSNNEAPLSSQEESKGVKKETAMDLITGALPYIDEHLPAKKLQALCRYIDSYLDQVFSPSPQSQVGIRWVKGMQTAWPLHEVLKQLVSAANILLHKKNYDGPDYEEIELSIKIATEWISEPPSQGITAPAK